MKKKKDLGDCDHCGIARCLGQHGPCGAGQVHAESAERVSDIRGYETWQAVAVSEVDDGLKIIVGNTVMIDVYKEGIPGNGKPFPEGSKIVKVEWSKRKNPASPYSAKEPDTLKSVAFIEKDSKRFPETNGWGYAQFFMMQRLIRSSLLRATAHSERCVTGAIRL